MEQTQSGNVNIAQQNLYHFHRLKDSTQHNTKDEYPQTYIRPPSLYAKPTVFIEHHT
jgi:hypothetical protein